MTHAELNNRDWMFFGSQHHHDRCNDDGTPVNFVLRIDTKNKVAYQVDERNGLYRKAEYTKAPGEYGPWQPIEPS